MRGSGRENCDSHRVHRGQLRRLSFSPASRAYGGVRGPSRVPPYGGGGIGESGLKWDRDGGKRSNSRMDNGTISTRFSGEEEGGRIIIHDSLGLGFSRVLISVTGTTWMPSISLHRRTTIEPRCSIQIHVVQGGRRAGSGLLHLPITGAPWKLSSARVRWTYAGDQGTGMSSSNGQHVTWGSAQLFTAATSNSCSAIEVPRFMITPVSNLTFPFILQTCR